MSDNNAAKPARRTSRVVPSFKSTAIEAAMAESERRARWVDQIGFRRPFADMPKHPFADVGKQLDAFADVGRHLRPFAEFADRIDRQMAPIRESIARAAKLTQIQPGTLAAAARKSQIAALDRLTEPRDSVVDTFQSIQNAKAEREAEQRAHQAAMVELLQGMVDRHDEVLRRQDAQLEIAQQTARENHGTRITANLAAIGALGAVLVVIAPTVWMQLLALPAACLLYATVRGCHAIAQRKSHRVAADDLPTQPTKLGPAPVGPHDGTATRSRRPGDHRPLADTKSRPRPRP